mmetsp:Transcript_18439/g.37302  ORF Transcript_18439/g.37302 Transcript_18439/m.37302 type:complete len:84 (-) Transcript_18439:1123-1374(-)
MFLLVCPISSDMFNDFSSNYSLAKEFEGRVDPRWMDLKTKGNEFFAEGEYLKAAKCYEEARSLTDSSHAIQVIVDFVSNHEDE